VPSGNERPFFLLVSDNCVSILNFEPPSRPLFGPSVTLSSVALYIRVSPLDLGRMSSSSFVLYWSQILPHPSPPRKGTIISTSYTLHFISLILTSVRESVTLSVKLFVTLRRPRNRGSIPSSMKRLYLLQKKPSSITGRTQPSL